MRTKLWTDFPVFMKRAAVSNLVYSCIRPFAYKLMLVPNITIATQRCQQQPTDHIQYKPKWNAEKCFCAQTLSVLVSRMDHASGFWMLSAFARSLFLALSLSHSLSLPFCLTLSLSLSRSVSFSVSLSISLVLSLAPVSPVENSALTHTLTGSTTLLNRRWEYSYDRRKGSYRRFSDWTKTILQYAVR